MDQFASRPTGSTTATIICLLHLISEILLTNSFVHLIALDFSKAFNTVRHSSYHDGEIFKFLHTGQCVAYNWVVNFPSDRCHHTRFNGILSAIAFISASIVHGSVLYRSLLFRYGGLDRTYNLRISLICCWNLRMTPTCRVVPASHSHTVQVELWMAFHDGPLIIIWLCMCQSHAKWLSEVHAFRLIFHPPPPCSPWSGTC